MKRKKLYYVPGLISLIGLPILLFLFRPQDPVQQTVLRFSIPSDIKTKDSIYSKYFVYKKVENKKVITIYLWDFHPDDSLSYRSKLSFIHDEIEKQQYFHDTSTVLKIALGNQNTYGDFVWLVNQATIYGIRQYTLVDNNFYIFPNPPSINFDSIDVEHFYNDVISMPATQRQTKWGLFKWDLEYKLNETFLLVKLNPLFSTGFFVLIFIPAVFGIKKMLKTRNTPLPQRTEVQGSDTTKLN